MSFAPTYMNGYYDDNGCWQRTKFCFVSCGERCDCMAPGGLYYSAAHDKRLKPVVENSEQKKPDDQA